LCQLFLSPRLLGEQTFSRDGPDFDHGSVRQTWTLFGDGHRLGETLHLQQEVAANRLLGFGKRSSCWKTSPEKLVSLWKKRREVELKNELNE
jgi:hypothetical protein